MKRSQIQLISAMLIFGSLGLFVRQLTLSSALIAFFRAAIGGCFYSCINAFAANRRAFRKAANPGSPC